MPYNLLFMCCTVSDEFEFRYKTHQLLYCFSHLRFGRDQTLKIVYICGIAFKIPNYVQICIYKKFWGQKHQVKNSDTW